MPIIQIFIALATKNQFPSPRGELQSRVSLALQELLSLSLRMIESQSKTDTARYLVEIPHLYESLALYYTLHKNEWLMVMSMPFPMLQAKKESPMQ